MKKCPICVVGIFFLLSFANVYAQQTDTLNLNGTLIIDQKQPPADPYAPFTVPLVAIAVTGAGILVTAFADKLAKNRQERIEMSKYKIDAISKSKPYFIQKAKYCDIIYSELNQTARAKINFELCLYSICCFLYVRQKIFLQFGDLQLDDLEAESIIGWYESQIVNSIYNDMGEDAYKLSCLAENDGKEITYDIFFNNMKSNAILEKFKNMILSASDKKIEFFSACNRGYYDLLLLEFNHIYRIWYGKEPKTHVLAKSTKDHILHFYPGYSHRIELFDKGIIARILARIRFKIRKK